LIVVYIQNFTLSQHLGEFTDELSKYGEGAFISEGIYLGAKNYALEITIPGKNEKVHECKVRGFTLNYKNSAQINFESMKKMLMDDTEKIEVINNTIRTSRTSEVYSREERKKYSMIYDKRRRLIDSPFETLPFGY
jgi:hypothetical protein